MKRVLYISSYYFPYCGGIEKIVQMCADSLRGCYEQKVICFSDTSRDKTDIVDGIEVIRCGVFAIVASQGLSLSFGKKLKEVMHSFKPDIVVFNYPNPFEARYLLKFIPSEAKLVLYWHLDIIKQKLLKMFFVAQNRRLIERADVIISTSQVYAEWSPHLSSVPEKCRVVHNCINEGKFKNSPETLARAAEIREANKGKIICVGTGRLVKYKGFSYLIQAAHLLDERFQIYIIGKGREMNNLKAEAGDDRKIHFLGYADDSELDAYMTAMDIFCFPSITKNEAFGIALAEAMYHEKPAVTFTIPGSGVNYVCLDGETGIECPNRDVRAYADALMRLADDEGLRYKLGEAGRKRAEEKFLYRHYKHVIKDVIDSL